jgi:hypothetical protein
MLQEGTHIRAVVRTGGMPRGCTWRTGACLGVETGAGAGATAVMNMNDEHQ